MDIGAISSEQMLEQSLRELSEPSPGITSGAEPLENSIELYLVQIVLIVTLCQLLGSLMVKVNQPRVIAEIIGGILLGPSFLGRIPGFSDKFFPSDHMSPLKSTATLGLVLFLFIVGLELDPNLLKMNAKRSLCLSFGGQSFCWAISILLSYVLYNNVDGLETSFPLFLLFIGVATTVTAFPVLSRILTENRLLSTPVGVATIGAAAFDDIIAWSMLALNISLANAGAPEQAAYILLLMGGFVTLMLTVGRVVALKVVNFFGVHDEVTRGVVCVSVVCVLASGWFTQMIGIDAIFGAFLVGLIIPRDGTLAVELTEKIEDVVTVLLLPLYFAVSGLKTDFNSLNSGKTWGLAILILFGACFGKIVGCSSAAKISGLSYRESVTIGVLMNTRGLVELIILNAGLDAGVINDEVFAIMVLMAVSTTFMTSPLASYLYPPHLRKSADVYKKVEEDDGTVTQSLFDIVSHLDIYSSKDHFANDMLLQIKLLVCLPGHGVKALSSSMAAVQLLRREGATLHAVRVLELSDRFSSDMAATNIQRTLTGDSVMGAFMSFCGGGIKLNAHIVLAAPDDLHLDVLTLAQRLKLNTVMIGWEPPQPSNWLRAEETATPGQILMEGILNKAASYSTSVAVAVDRGSFSQMPSTILVPITSFSHCEVEALLLAMAMSIQSKAEVIVSVIGMNYGKEVPEAKIKPARAVVEKELDESGKEPKRKLEPPHHQDVSHQSVLQWLNVTTHRLSLHSHHNNSQINESLDQIEELDETLVAAGKSILAQAEKLGVKTLNIPAELTARAQVDALVTHIRSIRKVNTSPALAVGGPSEVPYYPLIVCGRHGTGKGLPEFKSILGFLGSSLYEALPSTSLVVVHSATGSAIRQAEEERAQAEYQQLNHVSLFGTSRHRVNFRCALPAEHSCSIAGEMQA